MRIHFSIARLIIIMIMMMIGTSAMPSSAAFNMKKAIGTSFASWSEAADCAYGYRDDSLIRNPSMKDRVYHVYVVNSQWWMRMIEVILAVGLTSIITWLTMRHFAAKNEIQQKDMHKEQLKEKEDQHQDKLAEDKKQHDEQMDLLRTQYKMQKEMNSYIQKRDELRQNIISIIKNVKFHFLTVDKTDSDKHKPPYSSVKGILIFYAGESSIILECGIDDSRYYDACNFQFSIRYRLFSLELENVDKILEDKNWWQCSFSISSFDNDIYSMIRQKVNTSRDDISKEILPTFIAGAGYASLMQVLSMVQVADPDELMENLLRYRKVYT